GPVVCWAAVMRAPRPQTTPPVPVSWRVHLKDLGATLGLVLESNRLQSILIALFSLVQAVIPAASIWIAKLLLDAVARAVNGEAGTPSEAFGTMLGLLALQIGIIALGNVITTIQGVNREL